MELCMPGAQQVGPLTSNYVTSGLRAVEHIFQLVYTFCVTLVADTAAAAIFPNLVDPIPYIHYISILMTW